MAYQYPNTSGTLLQATPACEGGSIETEATMIAISFTLGLRQHPATTTAWHLCTVIIPRRTITGRLVRGQAWRRPAARHWLYKKFIAQGSASRTIGGGVR